MSVDNRMDRRKFLEFGLALAASVANRVSAAQRGLEPQFALEFRESEIVLSSRWFRPASELKIATLRQAVDLARSTGRVLRFEPGIYDAGALAITAPMQLIGVPGQVTIRTSASGGLDIRYEAANERPGALDIRDVSFLHLPNSMA